MIIHRIIAVTSLLAPGAFVLGCEHHEPAHHPTAHVDEHSIDHHEPIVVDRHLPPAPSHPPAGVTGRGHYVWDSARGHYLWVTDP